MTDQTENPTPTKTYDGSINDLAKALINDLIEESQKTHGDTPKEKIKNHFKFQAGESTLHAITALSTYAMARTQERQATAMESIAKTASKLQVAEAVESGGQAIVDMREPKREYLASTYSLPPKTLSFLWAVRGMLMDASIKSLSRPDRFDPYRRLTTEEIAWSLRVAAPGFYEWLPKTSEGSIDYDLLEEFDIMHYGGTDTEPEDWAYGG